MSARGEKGQGRCADDHREGAKRINHVRLWETRDALYTAQASRRWHVAEERGIRYRLGMRRIVLTGGPGAGKTVISRTIVDRSGGRLVMVPESATQVYSAWQRRRDQLDVAQRREVQRQIYALQLQQEAELAARSPDQVMLLDRGTLDGACYWPDGVEDYWGHMKTTHEAELARYDAVILMQSGAALGVYDGSASNAIRWEDAKAAIEAGERLKRVWGAHPRFYFVPAHAELADKAAEVSGLIDRLLNEEGRD